MSQFQDVEPLQFGVAIVEMSRGPTSQFQKIFNRLRANLQVLVNAASKAQSTADDATTGLDGKADKATLISAGTGLTGGGDLSADRTLNVDLQALLNAISTTRGTILYRGASGWAALAPGTAGQVLTSGGAGADPHWV